MEGMHFRGKLARETKLEENCSGKKRWLLPSNFWQNIYCPNSFGILLQDIEEKAILNYQTYSKRLF